MSLKSGFSHQGCALVCVCVCAHRVGLLSYPCPTPADSLVYRCVVCVYRISFSTTSSPRSKRKRKGNLFIIKSAWERRDQTSKRYVCLTIYFMCVCVCVCVLGITVGEKGEEGRNSLEGVYILMTLLYQLLIGNNYLRMNKQIIAIQYNQPPTVK